MRYGTSRERNHPMAQFMLSVPDEVRVRMDALRIVLGVSRSEIGRRALTAGGLGALESSARAELARLHTVARNAQVTWQALVEAYVEAYPQGRSVSPTLVELELDLKKFLPEVVQP